MIYTRTETDFYWVIRSGGEWIISYYKPGATLNGLAALIFVETPEGYRTNVKIRRVV